MGRAAARLLAGLATAWLVIGLAGCAALEATQTRALLARPDAVVPTRFERDAVPFFAQTPYHCGPAALATALVDVGIVADPQAIGQALFLPAREGTLQAEMLAAARRWGTVAHVLPPDLRSLLIEVGAGHAVVVLQNLGLELAPRWHYAVVVGYDLAVPQVVLRSGVTRREVMPLATFEHTWRRSGHWAMTALPPGQLPVTVDRVRAEEGAIGFERVAPPQTAAAAYATLLTRWPDSLVAAMGLGNSHLAAGQLDDAAQAFERAARHHDSAAAWNNLAQVRMRQSDLSAARIAAERALARANAAEPQWLSATRSTLIQVQRAKTPQ